MASNAPNNAPSGLTPTGVINASTGPAPGVINAVTGPAPGVIYAASGLAPGVINASSGPAPGLVNAVSGLAPSGVINATGAPQATLQQHISLAFANPAAGAVPILANGTALIPVQPVNKKKRKNAAPAINIMRRKRIRPTLIDDRVVISFFRELRMTRQFIHSGALLAWSLQPTDQDFINIHDYIERGQEHGYGIKVISIIRVVAAAPNLANDSEIIDFNDNPQTKGQRRMMLWHGTKKRCLSNILQNGLRMPTYTGQMFGPGIYFADRVSKSCNYCDRSAEGGFLLLCDVLVGTSYDSYNAIPRLRHAPNSPGGTATQSVTGLGKRIPDPGWNMTIDGTIWPLGKTIDRSDSRAYLQFNEFVVYDTAQVMPKYLVKFQFTQTPVTQILY